MVCKIVILYNTSFTKNNSHCGTMLKYSTLSINLFNLCYVYMKHGQENLQVKGYIKNG